MIYFSCWGEEILELIQTAGEHPASAGTVQVRKRTWSRSVSQWLFHPTLFSSWQDIYF